MDVLVFTGILGLVTFCVLQVILFLWMRARLPGVFIEQLIYPWVLQKRYWKLEPGLKRAGMTLLVIASMATLYGGMTCLAYSSFRRQVEARRALGALTLSPTLAPLEPWIAGS